MPYIVTHGYRPPRPGASLEPRSRRAVATLDEARGLATLPVPLSGEANALWKVAAELPESGGTVGPLPDGTTIVVEPVRRADLFRALPAIVRARFGTWAWMTDEQAVSAYNANAKHAQGVA